MSQIRNRAWAVALVLTGAASYGLMSPVVKLAVRDGWSIGAITQAQVLFGAGLLWLAMAISRLKGRGAETGGAWGWKIMLALVAIGIVGLSFTTNFYNEALARLDASLAIVLLFQYTWITILLESIRARKWPSKPEWLSALLIAAGTVLAVGLLEGDLGRIDGVGVLYGLLSAVSYALFFFLAGFLPERLDPMAKSAVMSTASMGFVLLIYAQDSIATIDIGGSLIVWGALLGFLGTAFPYFCFNYGIPRIGSGLSALLGAMELPAAVLGAFAILGEPLTAWQMLGVAIIIAGIAAAQRKKAEAAVSGKGGEESL
ncbi:DMT family transporter [Cohnella suwonensis]|uniref:DMT family transporter n=1 Tax=Cohnella suwonensis TaxID=696072 RepID=A0ABW0LZM2_9BACL